MINITQYCKDKGISQEEIKSFKKLQRIKPFLIPRHIISKRGRYGYTLISKKLLDLFLLWRSRIPLPLINRQEHDVSLILKAVYPDLECQHKFTNYIYDFFIPSKNLLIEYNETHHKQSHKSVIKTKKKEEHAIKNRFNYYPINQDTMAEDMSKMITLFRPN
jgi:hypothetical protein